MNRDAALFLLYDFRNLLIQEHKAALRNGSASSPAPFEEFDPESGWAMRMPLIEDIAKSLDPEGSLILLRQQPSDRSKAADYFANAVDAIDRLVGILENIEDYVMVFSDDTTTQRTTLDGQQFHAWVWEAAEPLWNDGHYESAVMEASKAVIFKTQQKVDRSDLDGAELFGEAFSLKEPADDHARLRFSHLNKNKEMRSWKSAHNGAKFLGMGCAAGIRNRAAHPAGDELSEQEALEQMAALSLLARWVDACEVIRSTHTP